MEYCGANVVCKGTGSFYLEECTEVRLNDIIKVARKLTLRIAGKVFGSYNYSLGVEVVFSKDNRNNLAGFPGVTINNNGIARHIVDLIDIYCLSLDGIYQCSSNKDGQEEQRKLLQKCCMGPERAAEI